MFIMRKNVLLLIMVLFTISFGYTQGFLRRQNTAIVNDNGPLLLKGVNIGNWIVEEGSFGRGGPGRISGQIRWSYCGEEYGTPLASKVTLWDGELPCTDKYSIDVVPTDRARDKKRLQRYELKVGIF